MIIQNKIILCRLLSVLLFGLLSGLIFKSIYALGETIHALDAYFFNSEIYPEHTIWGIALNEYLGYLAVPVSFVFVGIGACFVFIKEKYILIGHIIGLHLLMLLFLFLAIGVLFHFSILWKM